MHMFAGMALAAIAALLVIFLIIYPLVKKIVPISLIWIADVIVAIFILGIGIGLIITATVHLLLMGIFTICFGALTLLIIRKCRPKPSYDDSHLLRNRYNL